MTMENQTRMDLKKPSPGNKIVFLDFETTGLLPSAGLILEVGCIITDRNLKEIARANWVRGAGPLALRAFMSRDVALVHEKSGLLRAVLSSRLSVETIDAELAQFIHQHEAQGGLLGGRNTAFERAWMGSYMPKTLKALHYRNLDVSALTETMRLVGWDVDSRLEPTHRALPDCEYALGQARFIVEKAVVKPVDELQVAYRALIEEMSKAGVAAPPLAERKEPEKLETTTKVEVLESQPTTKVKILGREVVPPSTGRGRTKVLEEVAEPAAPADSNLAGDDAQLENEVDIAAQLEVAGKGEPPDWAKEKLGDESAETASDKAT